MDESGKSGKYPVVTNMKADRKAIRLVAVGLMLVALGVFATGTFGSWAWSLKGVVGATLSLLGGALGFAAVLVLGRRS